MIIGMCAITVVNRYLKERRHAMNGKKLIITIGRECGSGGHEIGEKLADYYGIKLYDRNLIELLAQRTGENPEKLAKIEEKIKGGFFPVAKHGFSSKEKQVWDKKTKTDRLYLLEKAQILSLAESESFVIIGRAANTILRDNPDTIKFFVFAPESFRIPRVKAFYNLESDREAIRKMKQIDTERRNYSQYYSDVLWGSSDAHDLLINSSLLGIDGTFEIMKMIIDRKLGR